MKKLGRFFKDVYRIFRLSIHEFRVDDGFNLAAGLSFFAILSLIPLTLILISVLGHLLGPSDQLFDQITLWVRATIPQVQPDFIEFIRQLVDKKVTSGWVGTLFLFFTASLLFGNIEHLLDKVLKSSKKRNFWHSSIFSISLIFFTALLFYFPSQIYWLASFLPTPGIVVSLSGFFQGNVFYFLTHTVIFFLLLNFIPNQSMQWRYVGVGAVLFACLIVLARQVFRWYIGTALERFHLIYGSLTLLVVLILWIYYLSLILVFCSEVVSALQAARKQKSKLL